MKTEDAERIVRAAVLLDPPYTFDDVLLSIAEGKSTVFETETAIEIMQVREAKDGERHAYAWVGGGSFRSLRDDLRPEIEAWARLNRCSFIELRTRPIAAKILAPWGYEIVDRIDDRTAVIRKRL